MQSIQFNTFQFIGNDNSNLLVDCRDNCQMPRTSPHLTEEKWLSTFHKKGCLLPLVNAAVSFPSSLQAKRLPKKTEGLRICMLLLKGCHGLLNLRYLRPKLVLSKSGLCATDYNQELKCCLTFKNWQTLINNAMRTTKINVLGWDGICCGWVWCRHRSKDCSILPYYA